ncbi:MAG: DUF1501 domain-containing protein [Acidimicrobiia bacterium]|nr:DUF1501 domain-containing protein [Acidimicrobiia bacterium]
MEGLLRRQFLSLGSLALLPAKNQTNISIILILQSGGCSPLDTFDMKPCAAREIRGEFDPRRTSVPGVHICEHLPRTARIMHKLTLLRSLTSVEDTHGRASELLLGGLPTDREMPLSQGAPAAARLVESGTRFLILSQGWLRYDTHGNGFTTLKQELLPEWDRAFTTIVEDLAARGLLDTTLVVSTGEFGRTPRINACGGRDHHPGAWSAVLAGAGLPGGRVIGATDKTGTEVTDSPVTPQDLNRTIRKLLLL